MEFSFFQLWISGQGFRLCKMYNQKRFDYEKYINGERYIIGFTLNYDNTLIDLGSTSTAIGTSFGLSEPKTEGEAIFILKAHRFPVI